MNLCLGGFSGPLAALPERAFDGVFWMAAPVVVVGIGG